MNTPRSAKTPRWPLYILAGITIFLLLLPVGIRIAAGYILEDLGAESVQIDDVDLNLFSGYVAIEGLQIHYAQQPALMLDKLAVNLAMLALLQQRIQLQSLTVSGLQLQVFEQDDQWVVGIPLPTGNSTENTPPPDNEQASPWLFGIDHITVQDVTVNARYLQHDHTLKLAALHATQLLMWDADTPGQLQLNGSLNDAAFSIDSTLKPFAETLSADTHITLQALSLAPVTDLVPDAGIDTLLATLSIDSQLTLQLNSAGDLNLTQQGSIALAAKDVAMPPVNAAAQDIRWQGDVTIHMANGQAAVIDSQGEFSLKALHVQYQPLMISANLGSLQWQGATSLDSADTSNSLTASGRLQLDDIHLVDQQQEADLLNLATLVLTDIAINGLHYIQMQQLQLTQLHALQTAQTTLASLGDISIARLQLENQNTLSIDSIALHTLAVDMQRNSNGHIVLLDDWLASLQQRMDASKTTDEPATTEEHAQSSASDFHYRIGSIRFTGDNHILFTDEAVKPAIRHPVNIETLTIGSIDSQAPETLTNLDIALKLYQYGSLTVQGDVSLLQDPATMSGQLQADIKGIELTDLSPYLENAIGYQAHSGQFNTHSSASIRHGKLSSETAVRILRIDLEPANEELIAKASQTLTMPVETALMVITDSDNTLKLTVPVKGDLSSPDIRLERIMAGAMTQAVKNAATTYFKYAVQPFGAIVMVSQKIGDMHLQARFEDVRFEPGSASIVTAQEGYLEKVAQMIGEKKNFSVIACVVLTDEDFQALGKAPDANKNPQDWDEQSRNLANNRLSLIRSTLINEHGLSADQVQSCKPTSGNGTPRAIIGI